MNVSASGFVPHHSIIAAAPSGTEAKVALVLHGVLGSGQNFRGIARRLAERVPGYSFVLVDIRNHGKSTPAPSPHTLKSCAQDLHRLVQRLGSESPGLGPVKSVIGHSFGGKLALEYAQHYGSALEEVWVLDSNPGLQKPGDAHEIKKVIRAVRAVQMPAAKRSDVIDSLKASGISSGTANWMATNVAPTGEVYDWVFDLDGIEQLLEDYFQVDLWPFLEQSRTAPHIGLVVAENSDRWSQSMRERALALPAGSRATTHVVKDAGHWLHVDNPEAVLALLSAGLEGASENVRDT